MRTKKELYQIVLSEYKDESKRGFGFLCNLMNRCWDNKLITSEEFDVLTEDFRSQKPSEVQHSEFWNDKSFQKNGIAWWNTTEGGIQQRALFLEMLISINQ